MIEGSSYAIRSITSSPSRSNALTWWKQKKASVSIGAAQLARRAVDHLEARALLRPSQA